MARAVVLHGGAAVLGFEGLVSVGLFVVVVRVGDVIRGVSEVPVVHQVLEVLEQLDPAGHQGDAQREGQQVAKQEPHVRSVVRQWAVRYVAAARG